MAILMIEPLQPSVVVIKWPALAEAQIDLSVAIGSCCQTAEPVHTNPSTTSHPWNPPGPPKSHLCSISYFKKPLSLNPPPRQPWSVCTAVQAPYGPYLTTLILLTNTWKLIKTMPCHFYKCLVPANTTVGPAWAPLISRWRRHSPLSGFVVQKCTFLMLNRAAIVSIVSGV